MNRKLAILWSFLHTRSFDNPVKLHHFQQKKLKKFLASHRSRFYPHSDKLNDYPIINKKIFMEHFDLINNAGVKMNTAFAIAKQAESSRNFSPTLSTPIGKITVGLSSGTSGSHGIFLISQSESAQWAGYILRRLLPKPWLKHHKIAFFLRANSNLYESVKSKLIDFKFYDLLHPIEQHIAQLNKQQPSILIAPAQVLLLLAKNTQLHISPQKIISVAEVLEEKDKQIIANRFQQIIHQVYQCTEGFLAHTCTHGNLHLNEDILYIEKDWLDEKSGRFVPIITDFQRRTQAIIRYRLDDILILEPNPCPCGSAFTRLAAIEGRCDDILQTKSQTGKPYRLYPDFVRRAIISTACVNEYTVIQNKEELTIALDPLSSSASVSIALQQLFSQQQITPLKLKFIPLNQEITLDKKRRRIICQTGIDEWTY